ncbi:MarR family transcriptional regulator [Solitalea sp. MAHUQ-68]|uniref:HTH-type transcriptional regulator n=1 Tax=Solitalea agri TaxID=2953739 RepID=A0A9X2F6H0_9SPHI|nr:MarR family transcriptional regulator [Solitalea agri]MCO4292773.1 MarR family transcriptional regulator [Solitalea agri]
MNLVEGKEQFIQAWGTLGSKWGINRTMAQVHALLMISPDPLSTEDIMQELNISRGNANMNVRDLIDWGLVEKVHKSGDRKEYFWAEKDIWKVTTQVAKERKKRELEPVLKVLDQLSNVKGDRNDKNVKAFVEGISGIKRMATNADKTLETMIKAEENWFFGAILKLFK